VGTRPTVHVEIWSDIVCPWCYIGKRRFERAVDELRAELDVDVVYRPFQLDPNAPPGAGTPVAEVYARKFGGPERAQAIIDRVTTLAAGEGLEFRMDRAVRANTRLAHRLLWYASQPASPVPQAALKERLLQAYFHDGLDVGDPAVLADCAAAVGFDRDEVVEFLSGDVGAEEVAEQLAAAYESGITAVPTYVLDRRWAVPGAQDPDVFVNVLRRMAATSA
jgi:predicted DsbA family dithiol-disulfide isomerase